MTLIMRQMCVRRAFSIHRILKESSSVGYVMSWQLWQGVGEAHLILDAALISFMAALTRWSGSMSVTRVWMIMNPKVLMLLVSWSFTSYAISSFVYKHQACISVSSLRQLHSTLLGYEHLQSVLGVTLGNCRKQQKQAWVCRKCSCKHDTGTWGSKREAWMWGSSTTPAVSNTRTDTFAASA